MFVRVQASLWIDGKSPGYSLPFTSGTRTFAGFAESEGAFNLVTTDNSAMFTFPHSGATIAEANVADSTSMVRSHGFNRSF